MVLNDLNISDQYLRHLSASPLGHEIDLTLGHRYKKNPRYTSCRYLVVYQILKVSNLSLNQCGRDAIVKFFGGGVTFSKVAEELSE